MKRYVFVLFLFVFFIGCDLFAFTFTHPSASALATLVRESLLEQEYNSSRTALNVEAIHQAYLELPRSEVPLKELYELKFIMQQWRLRTHEYLTATLGEREGLLTDYRGPARMPAIPPIKGSKFGFERWSTDPSLSLAQYDYHDGFLHFRGLQLRAGDILLADQNTEDGDGLFTSITREPRLASHLGQVVFLRNGERTYPAVVEIHEFGLRAVPLNVFLSPSFVNYAEVYRVRNPPPDWETSLGETALKFLNEPHSYDLWAKEEDPRFLTCTTVGLHLLRRSRAPVPTSRSTINSTGRLKANLAVLGFTADQLLTPTDFVRDTQFAFVGALDFLRVRTNIINEMLGNHMAYLLTNYTLNPATFPFMFRVNRWGLIQMERNTWIGAAFIRTYGFNETNIPTGPRDLMALFKVIEPRLYKAARWLKKGTKLCCDTREYGQ